MEPPSACATAAPKPSTCECASRRLLAAGTAARAPPSIRGAVGHIPLARVPALYGPMRAAPALERAGSTIRLDRQWRRAPLDEPGIRRAAERVLLPCIASALGPSLGDCPLSGVEIAASHFSSGSAHDRRVVESTASKQPVTVGHPEAAHRHWVHPTIPARRPAPKLPDGESGFLALRVRRSSRS